MYNEQLDGESEGPFLLLSLFTYFFLIFVVRVLKKLRGFDPLANYADRATAASWRSSTNFCG
jgi:hypothetical protein